MNNKLLWAVIVLLAIVIVLQTAFLFKKNGPAAPRDELSVMAPSDYIRPQRQPRVLPRTAAVPVTWAQTPDPFFDPWGDEEWDPFAEMQRMRQMMNRMFRSSFNRASQSGLWGAPSLLAYDPDVDVRDGGDYYIVIVDLPGMDKDKVSVRIENRHLIISGEREVERETRDEDGFYHRERSFGSFARTVPLPDDAGTQITAESEKGVLKVRIPKKAAAPVTGQKEEEAAS